MDLNAEVLDNLMGYWKKYGELEQKRYHTIINELDSIQMELKKVMSFYEKQITPFRSKDFPNLNCPDAHKNAKVYAIDIIKKYNLESEVKLIVKKYALKIDEIPVEKLSDFCLELSNLPGVSNEA